MASEGSIVEHEDDSEASSSGAAPSRRRRRRKGGGEKQQFQILEIVVVVVVVVEAPPPVRASGGDIQSVLSAPSYNGGDKHFYSWEGDLSSLGDDDGVGVSGGGIIPGGLAERGGRASPIDVAFAQENDRGGAGELRRGGGGQLHEQHVGVAPLPRHGNHVAPAY